MKGVFAKREEGMAGADHFFMERSQWDAKCGTKYNSSEVVRQFKFLHLGQSRLKIRWPFLPCRQVRS